MAELKPDLDQARRFLAILDPNADMRSLFDDRPDGFTFQTFDDNKIRKDRSLARVRNKTLDQVSLELTRLNNLGAGIFVTINETDGKGRTAANIERIRSVWIDEDEGLNIPTPLEPHIVTETSPGKFHKLFLVDGLTVEQHQQVQQVLVNEYGSDPQACDVPRVLRLAGMYHLKGAPFMVRIIHESGKPPYTAAEVLEAFKPTPGNENKKVATSTKPKATTTATAATKPVSQDPDDYTPISENDSLPLPDINASNAAKYLPEPGNQNYAEWRDVGMALHHQFCGDDDGLEIFDTWSQNVANYQGFDDVEKAWRKFGTRTGGPIRTFKSLVQAHNKKLKLHNAASSASIANEADKMLEDCTDYNVLVCEIAPKLWRSANGNVALEKDFVQAVMAKYAELRPGSTLTKPEALRAMKVRRTSERMHPSAIEDLEVEGCPDWAKDWVWVSEEEVFFDHVNRSRLSSRGFSAHFDSRLPVGENAPSDSARWLRDNNLIPKVFRSIYAPGSDKIFVYNNVSHVNTYSIKSRKNVPEKITNQDAVEKFKTHVSLICGGWNREAQILCNFLTAVTAERPIKVRWAPLIIGTYGDGKSTLYDFVKEFIGSDNTRTIVGQTIVASAASGQTGWAEGSMFCMIEEVKFHGHNRHDVLNLLKTYITNDTVPTKKLYKEVRDIPNTQNYMLLSNYRDAAPIDKGDRRYYILFSKLDLDKIHENYFQELQDAIKTYTSDIVCWLRTVPVHKDFKPNGHAPMTEDKQTVIRIVKDDLTEEVAELLEDSKEALYGPQVVSFTPLFNVMMIRSNGAIKPNEKHKLTRVLIDMGFTKLDRCRLHIEHDGDNRHSLWAKVNEIGEGLENARAIVMAREKKLIATGLGIDDLI